MWLTAQRDENVPVLAAADKRDSITSTAPRARHPVATLRTAEEVLRTTAMAQERAACVLAAKQ